jgi:hypothetical protein
MTAAASPALEDALAALRAPGLLPRLRERALPEGQGLLLRIVAGDTGARREGARLGNADEDAVCEAAMLYVQQVLFHASADSYRVLGARPDASADTLKQHHRWLLHWLHPDRQADAWEAVYAERVNRAWQDLRTPERRADYARRREAIAAAPPAAAPTRLQPMPMRRPPPDEPTVLSSRTVRRLPALMLGALAVGAIGLLSLMALVSGPVDAPIAPRVGIADAAPDPDPMAVTRPAATVVAAASAPVAMRAASATASLDAALDAALVREIAAEQRLSRPAGLQVAPRAAAPAQALAPVSNPTRPPSLATAGRAPQALVRPAAVPAHASETPQAARATMTAIPTAPVATPAIAAAAQAASPPASVASSPPVATVAAPAAPVAAPPPRAAPPGASPTAAQDLISRFRDAYSSGDIARLRALLAAPANASPREQAALLRDYDSFFRRSAARSIELHSPAWTAQGDRTVLTARYETSFMPHDATRARRDRGDIRFVLRQEGGEWRIVSLKHSSGRGG